MMESKFLLKKSIKKILQKQKLAVLATRGDLYPYTTLVAYAYSDDIRFIFFATMKHTRKYNHIVNHPYASLLIDSRSNSSKDFKDAVAITIMGHTLSQENASYRIHYLQRFPYLKDFMADPQTELIIIKVTRYIYVQQFQEVLELKML